MKRIGLIGVIAILAVGLYAQGAPTLLSLPPYTQGTTCRIQWTLPPGAHPIAYHIQVVSAEGTPTFPSGIDPTHSIFPIPVRHAPHNSYTIGLDSLPGTPADDPLSDNVRYCYRVQYRYAVSGTLYAFSAWSNYVCSRQDNSAPTVEPETLWIWTHTPSLEINFHAEDAVVGDVAQIKIYYRTAPGDTWSYFGAESFSGSPVDADITFNSAAVGGDGYYEFYLAGKDRLGNEIYPNTAFGPLPAQTWTRFDTGMPEARVIPTGISEYYTVRSVRVSFTASDSYSGIRDVIIYYSLDMSSPVRYDSIFYGGASAVTDSIDFVTAHDGRYGLYFQAIDSAGNVEPITSEEIFFNIDTRSPEFSRVIIEDTTTAPHATDVPAETGYTNSTAVWVTPDGAVDNPPLGDSYASGIESVYVAQSSDFEENKAVFPYSAGGRYLYNMTPGDGVRTIYVKLKDRAGNYSAPQTGTIILDTDAPTLRAVNILDRTTDLPSDTTDELTVKIHIDPMPSSSPFYKVFLTQDESMLAHIPASGWQDFRDTMTFTFTGFSEGDWMHIWVVLKDSAGNISNVGHDSIYYDINNGFVDIVSMRDINGPDLTGTYTDSNLVYVTIRYGVDVDSIEIWDDAGSRSMYGVPTPSRPDTTITIEHEFSRVDGVRWIRARGWNIYDAFPTATDSMSIILDTHDPYLARINVEDLSVGYDPTDTSEIADSGYTNDIHVRVVFVDPRDTRTGIYHRKAVCDTIVVEEPYISSTMDFHLPDHDGVWLVHGFVQDSAGNWSAPADFRVTLDRQRPVINSVTLRDATSHSDEYTDDLTILVETDAVDGSAEPAYIAFFEDSALWPDNLGGLWQPYDHLLSYTFTNSEQGVKKLYVAVKDHAGNISVMASDEIVYRTEIRVEMTLFDADRGHAFTTYTNSPTVGVLFTTYVTPPDAYYLSIDTVPPEPDAPGWIPYPGDNDTLFQVPPGEGEKVVYGWVRSVAYTVSPRVEASIILDQTYPDIPQGFTVWDTTKADRWPNVFRAHMGWANERYIYASIPEANDNLSGVDSLHFIGPFEDSLWAPRPFVVVAGGGGIMVPYPNDSVQLIIRDGVEGSFDIVGGAMDGAGNWHDIVVHGGYDTIPPQFEFRPLTHTDTTTLPHTIPMSITDEPDGGHLWKVCFRVVELDTIACAVVRDEWGTYPDFNVDFPLADMLDPHNLYTVEVVVVDSAGNASEVKNFYPWSKIDFKVVAPNDTLDSEFTNSQTVLTVINSFVTPDSMRFAETEPALLASAWIPFERVHEFTFSNATNEVKHVYCQVKKGKYVSPVNVDAIILDTIPPTMDRIEARDIDSDDPNWSDSKELRIIIFNPQDTPPGEVYAVRLSESPNFDYNVQVIEFDPANPEVVYTAADEPYYPEDVPLPPEHIDALLAGARLIYAQVLDKAENPSQSKTYQIVIDWSPQEVINFPNPFDPTKEKTYIRIKAPTPGVTVDIKIYDMFGNLVWSGTKTLKSDSREGEILWDGRNDNGDIVANGGYICIVDIGGKQIKRKIAVWKGIER